MSVKHLFLDKRVFSQSLLALMFNVGGIVSGRLAVVFASAFTSSPWILALFPLVLTVRGGTSGILSGKIGTMLHTGELKPQLRGNARALWVLITSTFVVTFSATLGMGFTAFIVHLIFHQVTFQTLPFFIVFPVLTCTLSVLITIPLTLFVAIKTYQSGIDPDILVYPIMSTTNDLIVSVIYLLLVSLILTSGSFILMYGAIIILLALLSAFFVIKTYHNLLFSKTLKEGILIVLLSSVFGIANGLILTSFRRELENIPSILILYPALIASLGDIGSILGSMETTKLALGYVSTFTHVFRNAFVDLVSIESAAFIAHTVFAFVTFSIGWVSQVPTDLLLVVQIAVLSNLFSFLFISFFALIIATQTFRYGLDPDNFVIPLTSSLSDTISTLMLIAVLFLTVFQ
jgi:mgtE-like transporter